ncbi:hypothetical protein Tco_1194435 [Tanacetum coccineum]|uniref:Uncharacterized protein n=1 Tax=Tanacetum coccineum TaxID=301880 RepID=A0ABQ5HH51_9ASTR
MQLAVRRIDQTAVKYEIFGPYQQLRMAEQNVPAQLLQEQLSRLYLAFSHLTASANVHAYLPANSLGKQMSLCEDWGILVVTVDLGDNPEPVEICLQFTDTKLCVSTLEAKFFADSNQMLDRERLIGSDKPRHPVHAMLAFSNTKQASKPVLKNRPKEERKPLKKVQACNLQQKHATPKSPTTPTPVKQNDASSSSSKNLPRFSFHRKLEGEANFQLVVEDDEDSTRNIILKKKLSLDQLSASVQWHQKKRTTDQFILARRDQTPPDSKTGPSSQHDDDTSKKVIHESSSTSDSERTESETEIAAPKNDKDQGEVDSSTVTSGVSIPVSDSVKAHEALAGPDPKPIERRP